MLPATPQGFLSDCALTDDHPGRIVPPRVRLQTIDTVVREEGGVKNHFTPKLLITPSLHKELKSFIEFSTHQSSVNEKVLHAHAFIKSQMSSQANASSMNDNNDSSYNHADAEANLNDFKFFEETPLVVVQPPTTAEIKKFGVAATSGNSTDGRSIQNQRSDFAKLLESSLTSSSSTPATQKSSNNENNNNNNNNPASNNLLPSYPEPNKDPNMHFLSDIRKKAADAFVERCKQLWQMFEAVSNPNATDIPPQLQKGLETGNFGSLGSRLQLLKQPLVFSLQVAMCTQDIANGHYIGVSWDILGGAAKNWQQRRIQLRDVFASEEEARKQVEIAVLIHKILIVICEPLKLAVNVEPSDLAVLAYFALSGSDGGDGTRLLELWPSGPLALFPVASFATFVPIKEAANATIDLVTLSRKEDEANPNNTTLRIRCSSILDAQSLLIQEQQMRQQNNEDPSAKTKRSELRIWKRPISSTIPENVIAAQEYAKKKDPRRAIANLMQSLKGSTSSSGEGGTLSEREEKRKAALEMAMRLAGQKV